MSSRGANVLPSVGIDGDGGDCGDGGDSSDGGGSGNGGDSSDSGDRGDGEGGGMDGSDSDGGSSGVGGGDSGGGRGGGGGVGGGGGGGGRGGYMSVGDSIVTKSEAVTFSFLPISLPSCVNVHGVEHGMGRDLKWDGVGPLCDFQSCCQATSSGVD